LRSSNSPRPSAAERDICFLYHRQAEYSYIMGDLPFDKLLTLPYWEYVASPDVGDPSDNVDRTFLRDGCLVMILAMAQKDLEDGEACIGPHVAECRAALARLAVEDECTAKLVRTVRLALDLVERSDGDLRELRELTAWVHEHYVRGYFRRTVKSFTGEELHFAAMDGDLARAQYAIASGAPLDRFDETGSTPLHHAARAEHLDVMDLLIRLGADVDAHDESTIGNTPLADVAGSCSLAVARKLLEAGADPTIRGWMQLNALDRAAQRHRGDGPAVRELLLAAVKDPRPRKR
jgi:Ankyrin repeats (3 copies)